MGKLLILQDSPDFGGHEQMLLKLLPAVLDSGETVFCLPAVNTRLRAALVAFEPRLRVVEWPFVKRRGEPYLARLRWRYRAAVRRLYATERPDTVLLVQGRIENLAVPMLTLPRSARIVSYLPMAHLVRDMRGRGGFGDRVRRALYRRPDRFIVPSPAVAEQVAGAGGRAPVTVAHNVVQPPSRTERGAARQQLGLAEDKRIALFIGRLDPKQKGLDQLRAAILRSQAGSLQHWSLVFVGDGPDRAKIETLVTAQSGGGIDVRHFAWTDRPELFLSAADVLLLPSRWEGLPLVMLEAMQYDLPILASSIDVYRQYLPPANTVDFDRIELGDALDSISTPAAIEAYVQHSAAQLQPLTLTASRDAFAAALTDVAA